MKRITSLVAAFLLLAVAPASAQSAEEHWKAFRAAFPYHVQTVAISEPRENGSRTVVISEPPPHVTLAGLREIGRPLLDGAVAKRHAVGVDGWVTDIVVDLPAMSEPRVRELLDVLHRHLFHTTYKAQAIGLPVTEAARPSARLDLAVSASDLRRWLVDEKESFGAVHGGPRLSFMELLRQKKTGVFLSAEPGLVVWVMPRGGDLASLQREARHFALDSDVILGAVADGPQIAVVGRERTLPVTVLPPLRTETIMLLASVNADQLAQSYERNNLFAGKITRLDWAPIYLSDALVDTEYGSLLNITDQLLKSWSMNGTVLYANFKYPHPSTWPFARPLADELKAAEVTFNWNTRGAAYTVQTGPTRWFALNRVGALPVSYFASSSSINDYEERAYRYFASTNDPNLARVVQYAALFQIVREFGLRATGVAPPTPTHPEIDALTDEGVSFLRFLATLDEPQLAAKMDRFKLSEADRTKVLEQFRRVRRTLARISSDFGEAGIRAVALRLANPRLPSNLPPLGRTRAEFEVAIKGMSREQLREFAAIVLADDLSEPPLRLMLGTYVDREQAFERFRKAAEGRKSEWIRTPSVVVSMSTDHPLSATGGHNLDALGIQYRVSSDVAPGRVKVVTESGRRVVLHHEQDVNRIHAVLREAAIEPSGPALGTKLEKSLGAATVAARPRATALLIDDGPRVTRGLAVDPAIDRMPAGWRVARAVEPGPNPATRLTSLGSPSMTLERVSDVRLRLYHDGLDAPLEASSVTSLGDVAESVLRAGASAGRPVQMHFVGFTENESTGLLRTLEVRMAGPNRPKLAGFTYGKGVTSERAFADLSAKYDFRKARVIDHEVVTPSQVPAGLREVRLSVEIPAFETAKPPLLIRIKMMLQAAFTPTREMLHRIVTEAFAVDAANVQMGMARLWERLKAIHPSVDVRMKYEREAVDIIITKAWPDDRDHQHRRRAA